MSAATWWSRVGVAPGPTPRPVGESEPHRHWDNPVTLLAVVTGAEGTSVLEDAAPNGAADDGPVTVGRSPPPFIRERFGMRRIRLVMLAAVVAVSSVVWSATPRRRDPRCRRCRPRRR